MPRIMRMNVRQIVTFLLLVFVFSSIPYALFIHTGHIAAGSNLVVRFVMWCPALAALATCALFRIDIASLGWSWRPVRYELLAYVLPLFYALPVYVGCWLAIRGSFDFHSFAQRIAGSYGMSGSPNLATLVLGIPIMVTIGMTISVSSALGEEIGWRGFLLPRLTHQFGFTLGCFLSGVIWAIWHYPELLFADYNSGTNRFYALTCFTLMVIGLAFVMGWFRLRSGSLWPCAVLHASHNLFVQWPLDGMTTKVGWAPYITTEFGVGMVITTAIVAVFLWAKRGNLQSQVQDRYEIAATQRN